MASAISSPMTASAAEMEATWPISERSSTFLAWLLMFSTAAATAASMAALQPGARRRRPRCAGPSWTMAWASTVAVVVPSPAMSLVLMATLADQLGAHVLVGVLELDLAGDRHPVVGDGRDAQLLLQDHVAAAGPRVTLTELASLSTPASSDRRALSPNFSILGMAN